MKNDSLPIFVLLPDHGLAVERCFLESVQRESRVVQGQTKQVLK
jgi:hypothetical protein